MTAPETVEEAGQDPGELRTQVLRLVLFGAMVAYFGRSLGAGAVLMIVGLVVMIFLHELGHYLTAKAAGMKVTEFFLGFGPRLWSFRRGETEYGLKLVPAGAYVRIIGMSNLDEVDPADEERTYRAKPYWRRLSVAVAGSTMHFLLAIVLAWSIFSGFGVQDVRSDRWSIGTVVGGSPAEEAGLEAGDRIVQVDGQPVGDFPEATERFKRSPGRRVELLVDRDGRTVTVEPTLAERHPTTGEAVGFLGVGPAFPERRYGPVAGFTKAVREFGSVAKETVVGLGNLFSAAGISNYVDHLTNSVGDDAQGGPSVSADRPTSVVGIVQVGEQAGQDGLDNLVTLLFGVNVFIGIFNLTPLLPFDGGHVVIATYEKIRSMRSGRRYYADVTKLMPLTYAVVLVLGLLFISSVYLDIAQPIKLR